MNYPKVIIYIFCLCGLCAEANAQKLLQLQDYQKNHELNYEYIEVFDDKSGKSTFEDAQRFRFLSNTNYAIGHGYSDSKFWCRFRLKNASNKNWILNVRAAQIDEIELFEIDSLGKVNKRMAGDMYPFSAREIKAPYFGFRLNISKNEAKTYYLSLKSKDTKQFDLIIEEEKYAEQVLEKYYFIGFFYFGMFFMMLIYNFLLYLSIRDIAHLYYVFYILTFACLQLTIIGFSTEFLWGNNVWFTNISSSFFIGTSTIAIALFSYQYLNVKQIYPKITWFYVYLFASGSLILVLSFMPRSYKINYFIGILAFIHVFFEVIGGTLIWRKGYKPARYYMLSWGLLFVAIFVFTLKILKILPHSDLTFFILPFGALFEVILLSFGLGNRLNESQKEKHLAQKALLNQLQENEKVRQRIARDLHDDLGSTLSSIRILSEFAETQTQNKPEEVPNLLARIKNSTQKLQENLQDIVWTNQTKDNNFEELLVRMRLFGGEVLEAKNINYRLKIDAELNKISLPTNIQYDIFMIFKESINNIVKYANAETVVVSFDLNKNMVVLKIQDDGIGFDVLQEKDGNGLKNMPRRAENIQAKFKIVSKVGIGTTINLELPVPQ